MPAVTSGLFLAPWFGGGAQVRLPLPSLSVQTGALRWPAARVRHDFTGPYSGSVLAGFTVSGLVGWPQPAS